MNITHYENIQLQLKLSKV